MLTTEQKMNFIEERLKEITSLFPEFKFFHSISFEDKRFSFFGTACPVCIVAAMTLWLIECDIQHKDEFVIEKKDVN